MRHSPPVFVRPGTTPIVSFYLPFEYEQVAEMWLTVAQRGTELFTKTEKDMEVEGSKVIIRFTQEETLMFQQGQKLSFQARLRTLGGDALASNVATIEVDKLLRGGVI